MKETYNKDYIFKKHPFLTEGYYAQVFYAVIVVCDIIDSSKYFNSVYNQIDRLFGGAGRKLFRTSTSGAVTVTIDGNEISVDTFLSR